VGGGKLGGTYGKSTGSKSNNRDKLYGRPGDIKVTTSTKGDKYETKIGPDGKAVVERHNTDHGHLRRHSNPHDHTITWDENNDPQYGDQINYMNPAKIPKL